MRPSYATQRINNAEIKCKHAALTPSKTVASHLQRKKPAIFAVWNKWSADRAAKSLQDLCPNSCWRAQPKSLWRYRLLWCVTQTGPLFGTDQEKVKRPPKDPPVGPDVLLLAALRRISRELDAKMHLAVINCILKSVKASKRAVISFYMKTRLHYETMVFVNYYLKRSVRVQKKENVRPLITQLLRYKQPFAPRGITGSSPPQQD